MRKHILIILFTSLLTLPLLCEGKKEVYPDSIMAVQLSDKLGLTDYSVYGAFPENECIVVGKKTETNGIQLQILYKLNTVSNDITMIFNPLDINFSDENDISSININEIWFINENEIYISLDCQYLTNDKKSECFNVIYNQQTHMLRNLSYNQQISSLNYRNDANRHIAIEKNETSFSIYYGDTSMKEEIDLSSVFTNIPVVYPGFVDSEVIVVCDESLSYELVFWDYLKKEKNSIISIPDTEYSIPFFSPDHKYVAMFSYKYGLLLINLNSGDSTHIIATYETRPQYWPLYTSMFWSWDSKTIYLKSNSKWFSIMVDTLVFS